MIITLLNRNDPNINYVLRQCGNILLPIKQFMKDKDCRKGKFIRVDVLKKSKFHHKSLIFLRKVLIYSRKPENNLETQFLSYSYIIVMVD